MEIKFVEIVSAFIVLFAVIDIFGSIPIILNLQKKSGPVKAFQATSVAFIILISFLFVGEALLGLFGVDISSFAIAGSIVLFIMAFEMIFGVEIFKHDSPSGASIVPIAFPLIAGAGSFTTLLSLRAEFETINIIIALFLNIIVVYIVLKSTNLIERIFSEGGIYILKKFFGIILLAMAVKLFLTNFGNVVMQYISTIKM
ncbi:MarC family protein [Carboxylicivirga caseinilyticus]|uniref:MarC family protein n=1 Tax=Carboxylicivirga caseinilyticus TaxID=3417572 RepID=UPI003D339744|nr:MarC family protein [Marinilabiliaceae bacterium A049]